MSKIAKLSGSGKDYTIGGVTLHLKPRTMKDFGIITDLADEVKRPEAIKNLIKVTLKEADPEATDEELDQLGLAYIEEITKAILDVNGLNAKHTQ